MQNYESEINTHTKVGQNMQSIINEHKGRIEELQGNQESARLKILVDLLLKYSDSKKIFGLW